MTKNITVFDSEGSIISMTYPKRAAGLVKHGRARYLDDAKTAIVLARSPEVYEISVEDGIMSTFSFNSEELRAMIEKAVSEAKITVEAAGKAASEIFEEAIAEINAKKNEFSEDKKCQCDPDSESDTCSGKPDELDHELDELDRELEDLDGEIGVLDEGDEPQSDTDEASGKRRGCVRFVKLSDEDKACLKAKLSDIQSSLAHASDEVRKAAHNTSAELGRYAENFKVKFSDKLTEVKAAADKKAPAGADTEKTDDVATPTDSREYYLSKIEEIQRDNSSLRETLSSLTEIHCWTDNPEPIVNAISETVKAHQETNRELIKFYTDRIQYLDSINQQRS